MTEPEKKDEVPVEQDAPYQDLVEPDVTGEPAEDGERPNLGEFGPDPSEPSETNEVE